MSPEPTEMPITPISSTMSKKEFEEMRKELRRVKNREASAESRRRVKQRIDKLRKRLQEVEEENRQLRGLAKVLLQSVVQPSARYCHHQAETAAQVNAVVSGSIDQRNPDGMIPISTQPQYIVHEEKHHMALCSDQPAQFSPNLDDSPDLRDEDLELLLVKCYEFNRCSTSSCVSQ